MPIEKVKSIEIITPEDEVDVYDIELPVDHCFYANDILVHNTDSIFTKYGDALEAIYGKDYTEVPDKEKIEKVIELNESVAQYINNVMIHELLRMHNTSPTESSAKKFNFNFKQELVIRRALFLEIKKKYAIWLVSKEGKPLDKISVSGIEVVRSDYPQFSRDMLQDFIEHILKRGISKEELVMKMCDYKDKYVEQLKTGTIYCAVPSSWNKENYANDRLPRSVKSMLVYNAIYGPTFRVLDRGYRFDIEEINIHQFDENVQRRLTELVQSGKMGKDGKLDCITIPTNGTLDLNKFNIDYNKMLEFAVDQRIANFCEIFGIKIEDPSDLGW